MDRLERGTRRRRFSPPHIGARMLKTAVAVFLCLAFYCLRGYRGEDMPSEAAVTAIICMQPYVRDSRDYALNRLAGTMIGAGWGLLFLLLLLAAPRLTANLYLVYALMAVGVLLSLYTSVAFRKPDASSLSAIVFLCIVVTFPDIDAPLRQAADRFLGVVVGTAVAVGVNVFHLPRRKRPELVFFVDTADLVPDRYSQIAPAVLFRLNSLLLEGAKICLSSSHAPAFFTSQVSTAPLNLPMIVMNGAAIYDPRKNRYLTTEPIPARAAERLGEHLDRMGRSYFLYTVHKNKTCIFHRGVTTPLEQSVLDSLRRSPYRSYLDEEVYAPDEVVCVKLIDAEGEIDSLSLKLEGFFHSHKLRAEIQPQAGFPGVSGLYIYSERATLRRAEHELVRSLRESAPELRPVELRSPAGYRSEHDAMVLLYRLRNLYAPLKYLPPRFSDREAPPRGE